MDQRKFLLTYCPHLFWEIVASNRQTLRFIYALLSHIFLSNRAWYALEANRLTCPLKRDVPRSSDLVLFLNGVAIFYSVLAFPRSAVPVTLKTAGYRVSTFQHSHHCSNVRVSTYNPPEFCLGYFYQQNLKVLLRVFHVKCISQWDRREMISIVE